MALTLALPLSGLNPEQFSTLRLKLLNIEREQNLRNMCDSGRTSPSAGSESSGISSLATSAESTSVELTPISSRSESPTRTPCKSQGKTTAPFRIMYGNRNILNLAANVRPPLDWQMKDFDRMSRYQRERSATKDGTKVCRQCGFCEPLATKNF
ncbi:PREDICTED: uncharacterized protein LOC105565055 isoform X2 [Vollenhovia emeryi]|uniref:uncharacterized protein LOC105565055 isoform X2 n=1 Tax=Vollenhovia emeryi TaxID=411798 RepID=UPI0005F5619B|nr:PREDICTED: uncharacterized protein LOC105565055 isoform X2 [Vollenhovia emeryi]